ncbi:MAG: transposase [Deltaproteobacteria bacterium]|nr:transposase [Deltaproteobacteria bacterium]MBI2501424.1 transposase [Deltaproteobacteria bacterium]
MGRSPRVQSSELHYHVIVRCNNREFYFESDEDFSHYLSVLRFFKKKHRFRLFNYELMNSHVHLLLQPSEVVPLQKTMLLINWAYARDYNRRKKRKGHFWLDRYKSIPIESDDYALDLMRYMNRNPVRAGIVEKPGDWKWSGYQFYALGEPNDLLEVHPTYLGLSSNPEFRRKAYRDYVNTTLPADSYRKSEFSDARFIGSERFGKNLGLSTGDF